MAVLRAGAQRDAALGDFIGQRDARPYRSGVHGHGLFREDVLAGRNRRGDLRRAKTRRRGQNHVVDVGLQQLLVRVEPDEAMVLGDGGCGGVLLGQPLATRRQPILERIGERDDPHAWRRCQHVAGRARSPAAAAHQADANLVAAGRVCADEPLETGHGRGAHGGCRRFPDEITA